MKDNVVLLSAARPECWHITAYASDKPFIFCGYSEDRQHWSGLVEASSIDQIPELLEKAKRAMQTAREQNREVRIWA